MCWASHILHKTSRHVKKRKVSEKLIGNNEFVTILEKKAI
jgi:hypothetical protein